MKKRTLFYTLLIFMFWLTAFQTSADNNKLLSVKEQIKENPQEMISIQQENQSELKNIRQETQAQIKVLKTETIRQINENRAQLRIQIENNASSTNQAVALKREKARNIVQLNRTRLLEKLKLIKDKVKKEAVERNADRLNKLNNDMTDHFLAVLVQLEKVLNNIGSRVDKAEAAGKDVATVRAAITNAKLLINISREAVKLQAEEIYNLTISGKETNLKTEVGEARQALHTDLVAVRKTVQAARDAVHNAATTLAQIPKVDDLEVDDDNSTSTNDIDLD